MNQTKCVEVKILQFYLHIKAAKYITIKPEEKEEMYLNFPRNETVTEKKLRHLQWQELKQILASFFLC